MWESIDYTRPDGAGVTDKKDQLPEALGWSRGLLGSGMGDTCQVDFWEEVLHIKSL